MRLTTAAMAAAAAALIYVTAAGAEPACRNDADTTAVSGVARVAAFMQDLLKDRSERIELRFREFSEFKPWVRKKVLETREEILGSASAAKPLDPKRCERMGAYTLRIVDRLLQKSGMSGRALQSPELKVNFSCQSASRVPDPNQLGGVLTVDPATLRAAATEDEYAIILAHELAHHLLNHDALTAEKLWPTERSAESSDDRMDRDDPVLEQVLQLKSRHEREADVLGIQLVAAAGYEARSALSVIPKIAEASEGHFGDDLDSHLDPQARVKFLERQIREKECPRTARTPIPDEIREAVSGYFTSSK